MKPERVILRFPRSTLAKNDPPGTLELGRKRTQFLGVHAMNRPLDYLLACAWAQGIADATQAITSRPEGVALLEAISGREKPVREEIEFEEVWPL